MSAVLPKGKASAPEIDALVTYMLEVAKSEDEAIQRISGILKNDMSGMITWHTSLQVEALREKVANLQERLRSLEENNRQPKLLPIIRAIFISLSFIAATVALLKAFGLINLPWLT
jgi:polyhydroxyalkanoate synthesis regulator phasin